MSNKYHVAYQTPTSVGEIKITQSEYAPITPEVLEDARRIIREQNNIPEEEPIVILGWQRFEE